MWERESLCSVQVATFAYEIKHLVLQKLHLVVMMEKRCNGFHSSKSPTFHRKCYFPAVIFCVIVFSGKKKCSRTNQNNKLCTSLKNCKITVNYFLCVCGYRTFTQQPRKVCIFVSFTFGWLFFSPFQYQHFQGNWGRI